MTPLRKRALKRKIRRFWKKWGISWEDFVMFVSGFSVFGMLIMAYIVLSIIGGV